MVEKSSSGMMFEGNTRRPWRFRRKAFTDSPFGPTGRLGSTPAGAFHPPLDGGDETGPQLGGGDDGVHGAHATGALDVVDRLEFRGHLAQLPRAYGARTVASSPLRCACWAPS